jgi:hypothetical protein
MMIYMADRPRVIFFFGFFFFGFVLKSEYHITGIVDDSQQRDDNTRAWCSVIMLGLAAAHWSTCMQSREKPTATVALKAKSRYAVWLQHRLL